MKKTVFCLAAFIFGQATVFGAAAGGMGLLAEYDSNVFGDYWGGGSLNANAYLTLGLDADLGLWGLAIGADYTGDFSTYLQYRDMGQSDHDLRLLLWDSAGKEGYLALGGGMEYGANGQGRLYYNNLFTYGATEGKLYLWPAFLARFSAQLGSQKYPHFPKYDCDRFSGEFSASLFLPSRTSVSVGGQARRFGYSPGADSLKVPKTVHHFEPGVWLTQTLANSLGLSVEYFGLINKVSTASALYTPDTLLIQVEDYSDYRGGAAGARLTARIGKATATASAVYRFLDYTGLGAFELPPADTSSLASRRTTGILRQDRVTSFKLETSLPLSPAVGAKAGLEYKDHWSNDPLFDYYRTILSLGLEYVF
jgi:hypothetical protein